MLTDARSQMYKACNQFLFIYGAYIFQIFLFFLCLNLLKYVDMLTQKYYLQAAHLRQYQLLALE